MTKEINTARRQETDVQIERLQTLETPQWLTPQISPKTAQDINLDRQHNTANYPLPKLSIGDMLGAPINNNSFFKKHIDAITGENLPAGQQLKPKQSGQTETGQAQTDRTQTGQRQESQKQESQKQTGQGHSRQELRPESIEIPPARNKIDRSPTLESVDSKRAESYLHGDGKNLPPIALGFKEIGLETLATASARDRLKPQLHVSTRQGDKAFPLGSRQNPYTSIQTAVDSAPSGSVINVHRVGTDVYKERVSITRSDLVVQTDERNPAVLDLAGKTTGRANAAFTVGSGSSDISIKNFEIRNFTGSTAAIRIDGSNIDNITVAGNNIHSASGAEGIAVYGRGGNEASRLSKINIIANKVHDLKLGELEAIPINGNVSGFKIIGNSGYKLDNIFIDTIGGERVSKNATLDQVRNGEVSFNYADGISTKHNPNSSEAGNYSAAAIYSDGAKNISIKNNYIRNADFGIEIGGEHSGLASSNVAVSNNVIEASNYVWLGRGGDPQRPGGAKDSYARDNVIIGNAKIETQSNVRNFAVERNMVFAKITATTVLPKEIAALVNGENRVRQAN
ncbi:hypothetical protein KBI23_13940 [bacterium]|nr:hypothetical protein [bacterium]